VPGPGINDNEGALVGIDSHACGGDNPEQGVIDGIFQRPAVDDRFILEL
jgi:hypothetical protein